MTPMTRRDVLRSAAVGATGLFVGRFANAQAPAPPTGPFTLAPLPYAANALEPHIDEQTMRIHHDRHHQAYVNNLNVALVGQTELSKLPIEQLLLPANLAKASDGTRQSIINNGGGHYNHTFFWQIMGPNAGGNPAGRLAEAIDSTFGNLGKFKDAFRAAALGRFGSGWAWLVKADGKLNIVSTGNQDCPLTAGQTPILGIDVWEHAYYLKYQNLRADYVNAWWNVVNWTAAGQRFAA